MSYPSSDDETDVSESGLDEYVDQCYELLKDETQKVKYSDEFFRCPYCPGKKKMDYQFHDLLQHASDVGNGSSINGTINRKGKHLGLVRYLKNDLNPEDPLSLTFAGLTVEDSTGNCVNELFVWPWMGILGNVEGKSISGIRTDLTKRGFDPVKVRLLPNSGYAVVEFKSEWSGFYRVLMFEKEFEANNRGKKDYGVADQDELCGWIAREDDYNAEGVLGKYLQKRGDLKTLGDLEAEEKRRTDQLLAQLVNHIDDLNARLENYEQNARLECLRTKMNPSSGEMR